MTDYSKITALYSRLSVGDEDRDGGESNSIQNQKIFLENYARGQHLTNIRHYIDDDESGRFFDRSAYSRMMDDVETGKIGVCIMKDLTRWGRDYLQVGNAMEIFRRNNVRFIAVNNGIDSEKPDTLEFAPILLNRTQLPAGISLHFSLYNKLPYESLFRIPLLPVNFSAENLVADYGTHLQSH